MKIRPFPMPPLPHGTVIWPRGSPPWPIRDSFRYVFESQLWLFPLSPVFLSDLLFSGTNVFVKEEYGSAFLVETRVGNQRPSY